MKKLTAIFLSSLLILTVLSGCTSNDDSTNETELEISEDSIILENQNSPIIVGENAQEGMVRGELAEGEMPEGLELPEGMTQGGREGMAEGEMPEGLELPEGAEIPEGMELPEGITQGGREGMAEGEMPEGAGMQSGGMANMSPGMGQ